MGQKTEGRKQNLDELRCLAMMMVVVLHFLGKGEILGEATTPGMDAVGIVAWVLESFCIVAVNVYMLISGYFLCESSFKLNRLLTLYLQVWMYSVGVGLLGIVTGIVPAEELSTHYFLTLLLPVSMGHYWFMSAYVFLYLLLPLVGVAVKNMTKGQLKLALILALAAFSLLKSVMPFRLEEDGQGYDVLWYLCVFLVAAYIRKFGMGILKKRLNCVLLYVGGCLLALAEFWVLRYIFLHMGKLEFIMKISFEYNHIFVLVAAVGLFGWFLHVRGEGPVAAGAAKVAPYVLGVYLLHENMSVRYVWQKWFGAEHIDSVPELLLWTIIAVVTVFITGVIVEWLRCLFLRGMGKLLSHLGIWKRFTEKLERVRV